MNHKCSKPLIKSKVVKTFNTLTSSNLGKYITYKIKDILRNTQQGNKILTPCLLKK